MKRLTLVPSARHRDLARVVSLFPQKISSQPSPPSREIAGRKWGINPKRTNFTPLKPRLSAWHSALRKCRGEEVTLCRLRTGHTHGTHGYLLCGADRPVCPRCGAVLSVYHVLLDCPQLEEERRRFLGTSSPTLSLRTLLGDDSVFLADGRLFAFVSAANLSVVYKPP